MVVLLFFLQCAEISACVNPWIGRIVYWDQYNKIAMIRLINYSKCTPCSAVCRLNACVNVDQNNIILSSTWRSNVTLQLTKCTYWRNTCAGNIVWNKAIILDKIFQVYVLHENSCEVEVVGTFYKLILAKICEVEVWSKICVWPSNVAFS